MAKGNNNSRIVFDLEANGLYQEADHVWCLVAHDIDNGRTYEVLDDTRGGNVIHDFLRSSLCPLNMATLIGHNIINYDVALLKKLYGWEPQGELYDTLVVSRLLNPDRIGGHGLAAWGERLGRAKPEHEDWTQFSPEMMHRCREDVMINVEVFHELEKEKVA